MTPTPDDASVTYRVYRARTLVIACERLLQVRRLQARAGGDVLAALEAEEEALGESILTIARASASSSAAAADLVLLDAHLSLLARHGD